jgi:tetratricopeptide (TPR) repeat protein
MSFYKFTLAATILSTSLHAADINTQLLHAQHLYELGDFKASVESYQDILKQHPEKKTSEIRYAFALSLNKANEDQKVVELLEPVERSWQETILLSTSYEKIGQNDKAIRILEEYVSSKGSSKASVDKYLALAYFKQNNLPSKQHAIEIMETIIHNPDMVTDESYYLYGTFAWEIYKTHQDNHYASLAEEAWKKEAQLYPRSPYTVKALFGLGTLYFQKGEYAKAKNIFLKLVEQFPQTTEAGDALYYASMSMEKLKESIDKIQEVRRRVYQEYPQSTLAGEAYLTTFPFYRYFSGDPTGLQHLQAMQAIFPNSPFLIQAYYFLGLDLKKDRKNPEGQIVRPRDLHAAIEAFQNAETTYEKLNRISSTPYFTSVRYRCTLERGICNLLIAQESMGSKKQIYYEYGVEVLNQIISDFQKSDDAPTQFFFKEEPYPSLYADTQFSLALALIKNQQTDEAEIVFNQMLDNYKKHQTTRGYLLSRIWFEKGSIQQQKNEFALALADFQKSEECAKGNVLSDEQKLDLWLQQSACLEALNKLDDAMLILSKVINEDVVSGLRLKAMYLRAEIYKKQGRDELAQKQLEALSTKNGEWALKAQQKLEEEYGL